MTDVLNTQANPEIKAEAAKGRIFLPKKPELSSKDVIDLSGIQQLGQEILGICGAVQKMKHKRYGIKHMYREVLYETAATLSRSLTISSGVLLVETEKKPLATESSLEALIADFEHTKDTYVLPAQAITAVKVLPFPMVEDEYKPVIDMRVITSDTKPVTYYESPGKVVEMPSPGNWFRFDLGSVALSHLT